MNLLSILHILLLFIPTSFYIIKNMRYRNFILKNIRWIFLIYIFIPLHWVYFKRKCIVTYINEKLGKYEDARTTSAFSETYMSWLYKPIMKLFGWDWDEIGLAKMTTLHSIWNILLIWHITFYIKDK